MRASLNCHTGENRVSNRPASARWQSHRSLPRRRHWRRRTASSSQVPVPRAPGGNDEFVELLNTSSAPVDISGWRLQGCAGASGAASNRATVSAGITLRTGGSTYLFGNSAGSYASASRTRRTPRASPTTAARRSSSRAGREDGVANQDASADVCARNGPRAPTANGDNAFERKDEGRQDTDSNLEDFAGPKVGDPQPFGSPRAAACDAVRDLGDPGHGAPLQLLSGSESPRRRGSTSRARPASTSRIRLDARTATSDGILVFGGGTGRRGGDRSRDNRGVPARWRGGKPDHDRACFPRLDCDRRLDGEHTFGHDGGRRRSSAAARRDRGRRVG